MNGTSIRNIKRNISEAATGRRRNRYGGIRAVSFKDGQSVITYHIAGLYKDNEYLKHRTHQKALIRAINEERAGRAWEQDQMRSLR